MAEQRIDIKVSATGAAEAAKVLDSIAKSGAQLGGLTVGGAQKAEQALLGLSTTAQKAAGFMSQAGLNVGLFGQAIGALASPIGLAAVGVAALGVAISKTTDFMVANYQQMRGLMAVTGQTAEETDQLADAFDLLGFNVDTLRGALFKMAAEVDAGGKGLRELGVNLRGVTGEMKSEGAIFLEVRNRISEMSSASERNAAAMKFFGRSAREMAEVFALSTAEFEKWLEKAGMMGPSAEESMRVTKDYTRALALFNKEWQGLVEIVGQNVLPVLTALVNVMTRMREIQIGEMTNEWDEFLTGTAAKAKAAKEEMEGLARVDAGLGATPKRTDLALSKAEVEDIKLGLKEVEAARLNSIALVQANMQAAVKLNEMNESEAAQQSIRLAQQTAAAKVSAIDGEIAAIRRTSTTEIKEGTEAHDKIRGLLMQRAAAHSAMAVAVVGFEAAIKLAAITEQREIAAGAIEGLKSRIASSTALLAIQQKSSSDIIAIQGSEEAAFRSRLNDETQAAIDAAGLQTKTQADYAAAVEAIMAAHYAKLAQFQRQASANQVNAMLADMALQMKDLGDMPEVARLTTDLVALNREIMAMKAPTDLDAEAITRFGVAFDLLDEATKRALIDLRALREEGAARAFAAELQQINTEAQLFGDRFDKVGATVRVMEDRLRDLARTSRGEVTPAMRELAGQLEELRQFQDLRDMFQDIFSSVGGAINTLVQGVILGTQTMADAFKRLGQSIVIEFVNRVIQQALNPLMKAAASVVAGLFAPSSKAAAAAFAAGGAGGSDAVAAIGAAGEPSALGTSGFQDTANSLGNFTSALGLATGGTGAFSQVLTGITSGWDAGFGGATGALSGGFDALQAVSAGASTFTVALAGVGAALAVFSTTMDLINGKTEAGIGGIVGGLAGGIAGGIWFGPLGALVGGALGDLVGSFLGGLFGGGPSNYELKRSMAAADANAQVGGITTGFAGAARTGTSAATLAALQSGQAPWGSTPNPLRTDLALPPALAEQLGLAAKAEIENGRAIVHWADVTQAQFDELITLFKSDPSMIAGSVRGKGDVSYLGQDKTHALGDQLEQGAVALLTAFTAFDSVRDKINGLASDIVAAAGEVMPPNMAEQLAAHIVNPIRDSMLAVLQDPDLSVEDMQAELDKMGATLESKVQSWEQFAQAMQAAQIIAPSLPDDLPDRMTAALAPVYDAVVSTMRNGTAKQAQAAADNYAKQVALWAAFGEAATHAIDLEAILPADLGDRFAARMQPQYDKILATLESGNVNLASAQVAAYTKQMAAWASIGQTVSKITSELAANSGDTSSAVETWQAVQGEMDRTVARAKVAFDAAISSGDIERVAKTSATYHDATMARLQAERAAVQQVTAAFDTLLKASAAVQDTLAGLAAADIGSGDATAFTEILHSLADIAMVAPTVQQRLSAISSGFSAIVTALGNADVDALLDPLTLFAQMSSAAAPFIGALSDLIETAKNAGDLQGAESLLQQQAAAINQLGAAAVQAVREWSAAAMTAIEKEAAAKSKAIDEQANAEIKLREAAIKNWQAQLAIAQTIEGLYTGPHSPLSLTQQVAAAAHAGQVALSQFQAAPSAAGLATVQSAATRFLTIFTSLINDQIALLQKWAAAEDAMSGFLESLYTGPNSPLSKPEQRGLAAGVGQAALSAYTASPTPEGLTALQAAASRYLTISLAAIREKADAEIEAVNAARDARVSALNAEIQSVQDAAAAEQQLIADRIDALQEQVAITREFEGIVKSVGDLIQSLTIGPLAAGNPADRLTAAKDAFAQAQKAFAANPTAGNAADVQNAAQALLPLAESLLSKPSPAYQALFASVIKVLEGVKGVAGAKAGPVSADDLEAQIKPLQAESKRIAEYAKQTVSGIQMQIEAANARAAETIAAINEAAAQEAKDITAGVIAALTAAAALAPQDIPGSIAAKQKELQDTVAAVIKILADAGQLNGMSSDDLTTMINGAQAQIDWWTHWRETETALVEKWKQAQIDAINETSKTTIANIEEGVAGALRQNAAAQKTITDKLVADTAAIAAAVTRGAGSGLIDGVAFLAERSIEANGILVEIRDAIRGVTGAATGMERVKEGLYHLHDDEMVVPRDMANQIRSAADGAGLPFEGEPLGMNPLTSTDPRTNDWNWKFNQPRDLSQEGQAWTGPMAAELNALELQMQQLMAQFEGTLAHNVQKKGGRRVQIYSDDELALMRTALADQVEAIKAKQVAIVAAIPKTPATPATPPATPPTVPPKVPPYTPPGPGWLTKTEGEQTNRGGGTTYIFEITGSKQDAEQIAATIKRILPAVQDDIKNGKSGLLVDARVKSVRK